MFKFVTLLLFLVNFCIAQPDFDSETQNVVTVPPNCPVGQEWVNGECRDIWRVTAEPINVITVPPNCPPGQEYVNGQCRDVWFKALVAQSSRGDVQSEYEEIAPQNVITAPPNCRPGQQWVNGSCRDVWKMFADTKNVVTVPPNCPPGQVFYNGQCRDIWRSSPNKINNYINGLWNLLKREERQVAIGEVSDLPDPTRNVISVPNQCPIGFKPDALGNCRPIM